MNRQEAKKRKSEFILPIRLDDTVMFGIPEDMEYLDYSKEGIDNVVNCLLEKLIKAEMHDLPAYAKLYQEKGNLDRELLRRQELLKIHKEYRQYILPAYQFIDSKHAITTDNLIFQLVLYTL